MKNNFIILLLLVLSFSCNKTEEENANAKKDNLSKIETINNPGKCLTQNILEEEYKKNPKAFELFEKKLAEFESREGGRSFLKSEKTITIPIHVNVLYNTDEENISNEQIQSQIDVLNEDYSSMNADYVNIPEEFKSVASGDIKIRFTWDPSTSVTRKYTDMISFNLDQIESFQNFYLIREDLLGGISPTEPNIKLNIWVCDIGSKIMGIATTPLLLEGYKNRKSGVVINYLAFGKGVQYNLLNQVNMGRTTTHEVGHWLGLWHTFGGPSLRKDCESTDRVRDTPQTPKPTFEIPTYPTISTCPSKNSIMTMNQMDYPNDSERYMFTLGQKKRMRNALKYFRPTFYF